MYEYVMLCMCLVSHVNSSVACPPVHQGAWAGNHGDDVVYIWESPPNSFFKRSLLCVFVQDVFCYIITLVFSVFFHIYTLVSV